MTESKNVNKKAYWIRKTLIAYKNDTTEIAATKNEVQTKIYAQN